MAGSAFKDAQLVERVNREFVPVLVDLRSTDETDVRLVKEHGVQLTPHVVVADSEGEQWGFLSDEKPAADVIATLDEAQKLMRESK